MLVGLQSMVLCSIFNQFPKSTDLSLSEVFGKVFFFRTCNEAHSSGLRDLLKGPAQVLRQFGDLNSQSSDY